MMQSKIWLLLVVPNPSGIKKVTLVGVIIAPAPKVGALSYSLYQFNKHEKYCDL